MDDIYHLFNTVQPVAYGGTGADNATDARTFLGVADATTAQYLANVPSLYLTTDEVNAAGAILTLPYSAVLSWDMALGLNATVTLTGNASLLNPSNPIVGRSGFLNVRQDATGSRTLSWAANWEFAGQIAPSLSTTPNAKDKVYYVVESATSIVVTGIQRNVG